MEKKTPNASGEAASEVLAALLDLLRNANREVQATSLKPEADAAVARYQAIANDLSTTRPFAGPLPPPPPAPPAQPVAARPAASRPAA